MFNIKKYLLYTLGVGILCYAVAFVAWRASGQSLMSLMVPKSFQMMTESDDFFNSKSYSFQMGSNIDKKADIDSTMGDDGNTLKLEQKVAAKGILGVQTRIEAVDTFLEPSDDADFHVLFVGAKSHYQESDLKVVTEKGILKISLEEPSNSKPRNVGVKNQAPGLTIQIPGKIQLDHQSSAGNLQIKKLALSKLRVATNSGDVELQNSVLKISDIQTSNGDVKVVDCNLEVFAAQTGSGDLEIAPTNSSPKLALETSNGDTKVTLPSTANLTAKFLTSSGDAEFNGADASDELASGKKFGEGLGILDLKSYSGDLDLIVQ